jgi:hypothetical protein
MPSSNSKGDPRSRELSNFLPFVSVPVCRVVVFVERENEHERTRIKKILNS